VLLNSTPEWDVDLECGASAVDLDLRGLRVSTVTISAGAARIHVVLDALVPETRLEMEGGVTSVSIEVPAAAGCEIRARTALVKKSFREFEKVESGLYRTEGFENAERKIYLDFESAVSSVSVERY
jgi:hypothetical protein